VTFRPRPAARDGLQLQAQDRVLEGATAAPCSMPDPQSGGTMRRGLRTAYRMASALDPRDRSIGN
jgi:hypothetical protein